MTDAQAAELVVAVNGCLLHLSELVGTLNSIRADLADLLELTREP